ncbi:MAG: B12-binding domain-containing radical SAM protein [Planctomycetaceae bacterium]|nr:B12-binding domain-containing radical SAM protein [Planctomycetaceae bacterium]
MAEVILFRAMENYSRVLSFFRAPLGLLHLAAALRQAGFSVALIDMGTIDAWQEKLAAAIGPETLLAGTGPMTGFQIKGSLEFSRKVKELSRVPVVWGGLHASLLTEQTLANDLVDLVVVGEGEATIVELAKRLKSGGALESVAGLALRRDGGVLRTAERPWADLDALPEPAYDLVDVEHYVHLREKVSTKFARCLDLNTDRGCPNRCAFCYNNGFNHRRWRAAGAAKVLSGIDELVRRYELKSINFVADNFCVDARRVGDICRGLIGRGLKLPWHVDMRIDTFLRFDDELLGLMRSAGCEELTFGVESGSDAVLEQIRKDITVEQVLAADEKVRRLGFVASYHFMLGFPLEKRRDVRRTLGLMLRLGRGAHVRMFEPSIYIPYPGTEMFRQCMELGLQPPQRLEDWIAYDWDSGSKLPWFPRGYKRYLDRAQTLAKLAFTHRRGMAAAVVRAWARMRLWTFSRGLDRLALDVALVGLVRRVLRGRRERD